MQLKWDTELRLTKADIFKGLKAAHLRHAGLPRLIIQSVLLAGIAAYCLIAYFCAAEPETGSLIIGLMAVFVGLVLWIAPEIQLRLMANESAAADRFVHLWVYDEGVGFRKQRPANTEELIAYDAFCSAVEGDLMVWQFDTEQAVIIPKRLVGEDCWTFLCEKVKNNAPYPTRKRHKS